MERNIKLDCLKGIAILVVILGHIIQFSIVDYTDTFLFNVIWSLQIPLFMLVSGYFSISSKKRTLCQKIINKIRHYLIPFVSCFIINCLINGTNIRLGLVDLITHLENSLWYLFVLFVLSVANDIACELSSHIKNSKIMQAVIFFIEIAVWIFVWHFFGSSFLGCKFIVYYSIFFFSGWLWRINSEKIEDFIYSDKIEILVLIAFATYFYIVSTINLYETADTILGIVPRVCASFLGIFILVVIVYRGYKDNRNNRGILLCGKYSLELYYVHYLLVRHIPSSGDTLLSLVGMLSIAVYAVYLLVVSALIIKIASSSKYVRFVLFGK